MEMRLCAETKKGEIFMREYVYLFYNKEQLLYVGRTPNPVTRYGVQKQDHKPWIEEWDKIVLLGPYENFEDANEHEKYCIWKMHPKYNKNSLHSDKAACNDAVPKAIIQSFEELKKYYHSHPDAIKSCTVSLRVDQLMTLNCIRFKHDVRASKWFRDLIDIAIDVLCKKDGHDYRQDGKRLLESWNVNDEELNEILKRVSDASETEL